MQHTDFSGLLEAIRRLEVEDLARKVTRYGCFFSFHVNYAPAIVFHLPGGDKEFFVRSIDAYSSCGLTLEVAESREGLLSPETRFNLSHLECLPGQLSKLSSFIPEPFEVGEKVRWLDPASAEYGDDKEAALARIFTVDEASDQDILMISDGATEAQVPWWELVRVSPEAPRKEEPFRNSVSGMLRMLASVPKTGQYAPHIVIEDDEGRCEPVTYAWHDKERGMLRLSIEANIVDSEDL